MKKYLATILIICQSSTLFAQCGVPQNTFSNNVYFFSANLNWDNVNSVHHYKIRYKVINTSPWSYKNNIDSLLTSKVLNNLVDNSTYIWQIRSHCDTLNNNYSNWSQVDTFFTSTTLCPTPNGLITNNINYNSAQANWNNLSLADRYRVHYRILNTSNWQNLSLINSGINFANIPVLQQNTTYEWQIMAYHDSTLNMGSLWSVSDTFTTSIFIPAPFNPIISTSLSNTQCNTPSSLLVQINQSQNEPDIGNSTITTDGGYFNISSVNTGDSVGYAVLNSTTQNINSTLRAGLIAGANYAIINSFDSSGSLIGFFAIENTSSGVRVSTTSPNDGNNYSAGYTSQINFTNLFVTPNISGDLHIVIELESELNDQVVYSDTVNIQCISSIHEINQDLESGKIYNLLGERSELVNNKILLHYRNDGSIIKKIIIE